MATGTDPSTWPHDGTVIQDLLTDLAVIAFNALNDTRLGCPDEVYLSHDEPPEDCCNFLALWVREWIPYVAGSFPTQVATTEESRCLPLDFGPRVVLSLRRPCAPDLTENRDDPFPPATAETAAAQDLLVDARALHCAVGSLWLARLAQAYPDMAPPRILYGPMTRTGGTTGCFGWDFEVDLEVYGCRSSC